MFCKSATTDIVTPKQFIKQHPPTPPMPRNKTAETLLLMNKLQKYLADEKIP
jgi:hypothetical protein